MGKLIHFGSPAETPAKPQDKSPEVLSLEAALDPPKFHHPSGIEPIEIIAYETFLRGEVIKLVMSAPQSANELHSLLKAANYLRWEIERVSKGKTSIEDLSTDEDDEDDES